MTKPAEPLPEDAQPRIRALVERSAPDPNRPRASEEVEQAFAPVDRASAVCYASAEDISDRLRKDAQRADQIAVALDEEKRGDDGPAV